jgi:thiopurine S-methyltransferase
MNNEYWLKRWKENRTGFHQTGVNAFLETFWPQIAPDNGRVLVPLCGKSADVAWLASQGNEVVGVDISEIAAKSLASEQGLNFTVTAEPPFIVHRDGRITYLVGDFFNITTEQVGRFNSIYDRAALIALPEDLRAVYARQLKSLLKPGGHVLLIALEYDPREMEGPPYSVAESEIRANFDGCEIRKLDVHDCLEEEHRFKERGLTWMREVVYDIRSGAAAVPWQKPL